MSYKHPAEANFPGRIGRTIEDSEPSWPEPAPHNNAPNIVVIVLDDVGFSHLGCYGSSIQTPNIDQLAAEGLRYTGFHTTALCSATRACLLTGRNHHTAGIRAVSNFDTGYPNTRGGMAPATATVAEILRGQGYSTFASGKWHVAPMRECSAAGPFHNWPLQKGFDRFYGFLQGETDQFYPELTYDNHFVSPPKSPEQGYHLAEDIVDHSLGFIRDSVSLIPERPWMLYLSFGTAHSPHQAPQSFVDKYRGAFDEGWDVVREQWFQRQKALGIVPPDTVLPPSNPGVAEWSELSDDEQRFAARLQEAFAGMLDHTDQQIGRLRQGIENLGIGENTLFVLLSDNGASQEGGATGTLDEMRHFNGMKEDVTSAIKRLDDIGSARSHSNIPWGWAQAGNTPLKWYKQNTHGGGVRDPLIIHWPAKITTPGAIRNGFCHAVDLTPTLLDIIGIAPPETVAGVAQLPMHGVSLKETLLADVPVPHPPQYFEMFGHRAIWADGWKAVTRHKRGASFETEAWELYNLSTDFSESSNRAAGEPQRLAEMEALWWHEAERHGVLPLDDRQGAALFRASRRKGVPNARKRFVYYPPISHIVADACPAAYRGWVMQVDVEHGGPDAEGILVSRGTINSGFVLYFKAGKLHFDYNCFHEHSVVATRERIEAGPHRIEATLTLLPDETARVQLAIDGRPVAEGHIPKLLVFLSSTGMDIGRCLAPVTEGYQPPFEYQGRIGRVIIELPASGSKKLEDQATKGAIRAIMSQQ